MNNFLVNNIGQNVYLKNINSNYREEILEKLESKNTTFKEIYDSTIDKYSENIETSEKHDIRNATFEEMCKIAKESLDKGEIEFKDYMVLVLDKSKIIEQFNQHYRSIGSNQRVVTINNPMFEGYDGKKHDWIDLIERKGNQQLKLGNKQGYTGYMKVREAFKEGL